MSSTGSSPLPTSAERDDVHAELTGLLVPGGDLHWDHGEVHPALDDDALIARVTRRYRAMAGTVTIGGAAAVVTAGPPGAGKSTAMGAEPFSGYRRIDPDEIKDLLLEEGASRGLLDGADGVVLCDGRPVMQRELSARTHKASTDIADAIRDEAMAMRENVLIEGTLTWDGMAAVLARRLADNDYDRLRIVDVEVPADVAIERVRERWWSRRIVDAPLGGRFMTDADVVHSYEKSTYGRDRSQCADVAEDLFARSYGFLGETILVRHQSAAAGTLAPIKERVAYDGVVTRDTLT